MINFKKATFIKSAAKVPQLPEDTGAEVAFAGRSNAGKSSAINCLTHNKHLARTSKTPGRTRLMNCFALDDNASCRLVDLPGYGYAKVSREMQAEWQKHLAHYFDVRQSLKGVVILMDIRHPLTSLDESMIAWALDRQLRVHAVLTKADKLSKSRQQSTLLQVKKCYTHAEDYFTAQTFSSLKREGVEELISTVTVLLTES